MMFLTCLDCRIQADDVVFRKKGKGAERPNSAPRCEACVHQHSDRQPAMIAKKARRQEQAAERDMEQIKQDLIADAEAKAQAHKRTAAQFKQSQKLARISRKAYIKSIQDAIVAKYCAENPDFTPMSRQAESSRTGTYLDARNYTRSAHQDRIRGVPKIVSWSELQNTSNSKGIIRAT